MSEFLDKRLSDMLKAVFEKEGITPYEEPPEEPYQSQHDIKSNKRAQMLLDNPSLLKCLTMPEIDCIRKTGVVPDDLEQRLIKQLKSEEAGEK